MVVDIEIVKTHIKPKADSTLRNMRKDDMIEYIRCLENNYNVAVSFNNQQAKNIEALGITEVVRCRDCIHAVELEKDYVRKLFVDGTKQCELGRSDKVFGYSIISNDGFCDSGERK